MLEYLKKSWLVPAIILLALTLVVVNKCHWSLTDVIAQRVIEKLNADYSPVPPPVPDGAR